MDRKKCTNCKEVKPIDAFGKDRSRRDGLNPKCKPCNVKRARDWNVKNKERFNENRMKSYYGKVSGL